MPQISVNFSQLEVLLGQLGLFLTGVAAILGVVTIGLAYRQNRRDAIRLKYEQWRISYRNLNIKATHTQTHTANVPIAGAGMAVVPRGPGSAAPDTALTQFSILQLSIENVGDGPVDIWGCLVAARELSGLDHRESWGGNIEWNDLEPYYFDATEPYAATLAGISNTRHCVYSQEDYVTLDPKEKDTLTRIDRIEPVTSYRTLLYRVFLAGRGYGGSQREDRDILAWQRLQQALFNISGPSFRILLDEDNPLDLVADRDGWQCFMLYHMAFTDDNRDKKGWTYIDYLNTKLEGEWGAQVSEETARQYCREQLAGVAIQWRRHWEAFHQAVAECKRLPNGFVDMLAENWRPTIPTEPGPSNNDDLTQLSIREAFARLPQYLRWDPENDDSLPVWESFFLVTLQPEVERHASVARVGSDGSEAASSM
jgi:hypothetical protein